MSVLVFGGPRSLGELASSEQVSPATMSRTVDALVTRGLVRRVRPPEDRRRVMLSATARGRRTLERARRERLERLEERLETLGDPELRLLARSADLIERVIAGTGPQTPRTRE
jgi:DNA-binding MarR family transcriptional regulator